MTRALLLFPLLVSFASAGLLDLKGKPIDEYSFQIEGRIWRASLSGEVEADAEFLPGTNIDFEDELNLDSEEQTWEASLQFKAKGVVGRVQYVEVEFEDDTTLSRSISFEGTTFSVSERVTSEVEFRVGSLDLEYLLLDVGSGATFGLEIGLGIGVRWLAVDGEIQSETTGFTESENKDTYLPVLSASASLSLFNLIRVDAHVSGFRVELFGVDATLIDGSVSAKLFLHHAVYVGIGYRLLYAELDYHHGDDFEVELQIDGFFVSAGLVF